jgi:lactoylglutathione lyase
MRIGKITTVVAIFSVASFFALILGPRVSAQVIPTGAPDHIHLASSDPETSVAWYLKHFGGVRYHDPRPGQPDEVLYDRTVLRFWKRDEKPSDGSVLDRIGFTVSDVDATVAGVVADGGKVLIPARDVQGLKIRVAFVQDPWGSKVEVLHDPDLPNRLHLIALRAPDPEPLFKWMSDTFGGVRDKYQGRFEGLKYGNLWVLIQKSDMDTAPSSGHAIDHLGWAVPNMDQWLALLKSKGYKITVDPPRQSGPLKLSYIEGPNGISVELTDFGSAPAPPAPPPQAALPGGSFGAPGVSAPAPSIAGISPPQGPAGTRVTIVGAGFVGVTSVTFGASSTYASTVSQTTINTTVPDVTSEDSVIATLGPQSHVSIPVTVYASGGAASTYFNYTGPR